SSSFAPPRDLHSFPTRRSSDLQRAADPAFLRIDRAGEAQRGHGGFAVTVHVADRDETRHRREPRGLGDRSPTGRGTPFLQERLGDRKSTRLNSSHVKISYAVFC